MDGTPGCPSQQTWAAELARKIERNDSRQAFLWTIFASLATGAWILLAQSKWLAAGPSRWEIAWALALVGLLYLVAAAKAVGAIIVGANPPWAKGDSRFSAVILKRYVAKFGPPKAGRLIAFGKMLIFVLVGSSLLILALENDGLVVVLLFAMALNFLWSGFVTMLPFLLSNAFLANKVGTTTAGTMRLLEGNESDAADSDMRMEELRGSEAWTGLLNRAKGLVGLVRLALKANGWFYLALFALVFFTGPEGPWQRIQALAIVLAGLLLVLMALNLWLHLYVDQSRSLLEQLHHLVLTGALAPERVERALFVIEAMRRNHYILQLPMEQILAELGADEVAIKDPILDVDVARRAAGVA